MSTYIEVHHDDDDESQPSTSTCSGGARVRTSDSYNTKTSDVSFDLNNADCDMDITSSHRALPASRDNHPQSKSNHHHHHHHSHNHHHGHNQHQPSSNHVHTKPPPPPPPHSPEDEYKEPEHGTMAEVREYDFCLKSPMSTGHIIDLRGREVLFAIGVFFFLSVSIGLIVVLASMKVDEMKLKKQENGKQKTCLTKECMSRAAEMLSMMDTSADPCSNFYRYACGGWDDSVQIPQRENSWGVSKALTYRINNDVLQLLESDISRNTSASAERKMKLVYTSCMDLDAVDDLGAGPLMNIMDRVGGWSIFEDWNLMMKPGIWHFQTFLEELHHTYYIRVFFTMFVHPDNQASGNVLQFDQSVLPYPDVYNPFMYREELGQAYADYLREVARLFGATESNVEQFVNSTIFFERTLAEIHQFDYGPSMGNPQDNYNAYTVRELQYICPMINWLHYIQASFPEIEADSTILVTDITFFQQLTTIIKDTEGRVLNYYMMWRLVDDFAPNLPVQFRKAHERFSLIYTGNVQSGTRQRYCVDLMGKMFGFELGASFVHKYFPPRDKYAVQDMVAHVRDSLHRTLNDNTWLINTTKQEAMNKVTAMEFRVGYPEFIKEQDKVDEYYTSFSATDGDSFFQNLISYYRHENELSRLDLKGKLHAPEWIMQPYEVNAFTNPFDNVIVLPAGVLQSPHFDNTLPKYINYGSFGSVVGHEMMHAFDSTGALFDAEGIMRPWWDWDSQEEYFSRLQCVADYYSTKTYRQYKINGTTTENENLADIEGLKVAYMAYQRMMGNKVESTMPGINLSNKQIFFLSFAQNYCKIRRPEYIEGYLEHSNHMIEEIRVTGTLAQVPAFAEMFSCRKGGNMNPSSRCSLW